MTTGTCKCGHPQGRHARLAGTYAHCIQKNPEAAYGRCGCGMYRPQDAQPAAAPSVPADADLRERIAALFRTAPGAERLGDATPGEIADAVLAEFPAPADLATVLREAAVELRKQTLLHDDCVCLGELRRMADEAQQSDGCPGCGCAEHRGFCDCGCLDDRMADEAQKADPTRRTLSPNEHDRAWHAIEGAAGEPGADPGTVLKAVLAALGIDAPTAEEEQAASPRRLADEAQQTGEGR